MEISEETNNTETHLQKPSVPRHGREWFSTIPVFLDIHGSSWNTLPSAFSPLPTPLTSVHSCCIPLFLQGCVQLLTAWFSVFLRLLEQMLPVPPPVSLQRPTLTPVMKWLRELYKSTSYSSHSSAVPNARYNLVGRIPQEVTSCIDYSAKFSEWLFDSMRKLSFTS